MSIFPFSLQQSKPNKLEYESHTKGLMTRRHQARLTRRIREEFPKQKSHDANDNATPTAGWRIEVSAATSCCESRLAANAFHRCFGL